MQPKITPNLWFDTEAEEAAGFYTSVFNNSRIVNLTHYPEGGPGPVGTVMTVEFELDGQRFVAINGGPQFTFDEAVSFEVPHHPAWSTRVCRVCSVVAGEFPQRAPQASSDSARSMASNSSSGALATR